MIKRDFYFSIFLLALAAAVVIESLRMPRELAGHSPYAAPGLVPGIIGIAIFICALILLLKTVKNSPNSKAETKNNPDQWQELSLVKPEDPKPVEEAEPAQWKPLLITILLVAIYAAGLIGTVPFWLATFLFVSAFIIIFEWKREANPTAKTVSIGTALLQAAAVAWAVTWLFEGVFRVTLPG